MKRFTVCCSLSVPVIGSSQPNVRP